MKEKLVITGMGAVTPIGTGIDTYWDNLVQGVCGIDRITRFDTQDLAVQIAAEVKDFNPKDYISPKLIREMDLFQQYAFAAADEALEQSSFPIQQEPSRIGIVMGTAMNGVATTAATQEELTAGKAQDFRQSGRSPAIYRKGDPRPQLYVEHGLLFRRGCAGHGSHDYPLR